MFLQAIATALPQRRYTQAECWRILESSSRAQSLSARSRDILRKVLTGPSGIETRHFSFEPIEQVFDQSPEALNKHFEVAAPKLGADALKRALGKACLSPDVVDAIFVCTCTGYLCPGLSSFIAEIIGLRSDIVQQDLVGLGCGAAIPTIQSASHFLAAHPDATAAVLAIELCSAAFFLDDDPGVLISACLFADGAAATIWSGDENPSPWRATDFRSLHIPTDRELLRFENRDGFLRNRLHRSVPERAALAVNQIFPRETAHPPIDTLLCHPGGRDVLDAIATFFPQFPLSHSTDVLRKHGNMSSPSILFALDSHIQNPGTSREAWLTSFGAGFSCHGFRLSYNPSA